MQLKFIHAPYTEASIQAQYKALAKEFHPDKGGSVKLMQTLNQERDYALQLAKSGQTERPRPRLAKKVARKGNGKVFVFNLNLDNAEGFLKEINKLAKKFKG